jgi:hypothetical protein
MKKKRTDSIVAVTVAKYATMYIEADTPEEAYNPQELRPMESKCRENGARQILPLHTSETHRRTKFSQE